ncbi:MAG TPA: DegT/DnrJ/EryC1/StrS family aminotransferase, partial [Chitinophagales bacterium]|nr:DegT/DnrJ/EryC1/StrS family aminotransferase [Chitinophagales bacterium]
LIQQLKAHGILSVFHYVGLHCSPFHKKTNAKIHLANAEYYSDGLIRLPLFYDLDEEQIKKKIAPIIVDFIVEAVK